MADRKRREADASARCEFVQAYDIAGAPKRHGINRMRLSVALLVSASMLLDGCSETDADQPAGSRAQNQASDRASISADTRRVKANRARVEYDSPRYASSIDLVAEWSVGGPADPGRLIQPLSLMAADVGVLVSELDGNKVKIFSARDGSVLDSLGRNGLGPGEFGRVPQLLGMSNRPLAFEGPNGRISALARGKAPETSNVARTQTWRTACAVARDRVVLQYSGWEQDGFFVSTLGDSARIVDSVAYPFPELIGVSPLARQASLQQMDDTSCAVLPAYAGSFAILAGGAVKVAAGIEPVPTPGVVESKVDAGVRRRLADDVRASHLSAATWRGRVLILFYGRSRLRGRVVDVYSPKLDYEGSVLLPWRASFISVKNDILYAIGEDEDEPVLAAFRLAAEGTNRLGPTREEATRR